MICRVEKLVHGGKALARFQGKVVFVSGALPGERIAARIVRQNKDYAEAEILEVIEPVPDRVAPRCPYYGVCGGCDLQHASLEKQREWKRRIVEDLFRRLGGIALPDHWTMHGQDGWGYRSRARFARGAGGAWGFRAARSRAVIEVKECPVLTRGLNATLREPTPRQSGMERSVWDSGVSVVSWDGVCADPPAAVCRILGREIRADAAVFFQSNLGMTETLILRILDLICDLPRGRAVDLFCGVGLFAAFLQDHFEKVQAVESDPKCLSHARLNLGERVSFVSAPAQDWLTGRCARESDLIVVDPPRGGLPQALLRTLIKSRPRALLYVSCDPATLARDAGVLTRAGMELRHIEGFDFYPQTHHVETLALFRPGG